MIDLAATFENTGLMHPVPEQMHHAEYTVLFLKENTYRSGLSRTSAAKAVELFAEYRIKSNRAADDLLQLMMLYGLAGQKIVTIFDMVIKQLEELKRKDEAGLSLLPCSSMQSDMTEVLHLQSCEYINF